MFFYGDRQPLPRKPLKVHKRTLLNTLTDHRFEKRKIFMHAHVLQRQLSKQELQISPRARFHERRQR